MYITYCYAEPLIFTSHSCWILAALGIPYNWNHTSHSFRGTRLSGRAGFSAATSGLALRTRRLRNLLSCRYPCIARKKGWYNLSIMMIVVGTAMVG